MATGPVATSRRWLVVLLALAAGCDPSQGERGFPSRPVKVVVPFGAGGGSDMFVRVVQQAIRNGGYLPQPLVVINLDGAGATIGSRRVKNAPPDGYTVLALHEAIITARYYGMVDYGPEAFEPIAATGEVAMVVAVAEDSPYADLGELMQAAADRPDEVVYGANLGAPSHFVGLLLEGARSGARFRYTQTGGGASRFASLKGGHVQLTSFSIEEYLRYRPSGLRALAVLSGERHPAVPEIPTAAEQGFAVASTTLYCWWAPSGTPAERVEVLADALEQAMRDPLVLDRLAEVYGDPVFLRGDALRSRLSELESQIAGAAQRKHLPPLPDYPRLILAAIIVLGALVVVQSIASGRGLVPPAARRMPRDFVPSPWLAVLCVGLLAAYIAVLAAGWPGFRAATLTFVLACGGSLARGRRSMWCAVGVAAIVMAFGLDWLFARLLNVDLF